jgi:hypothetical protein
MTDERGATLSIRAFPGQFSDLKTRVSVVAPALGQHTRDVLSELNPS